MGTPADQALAAAGGAAGGAAAAAAAAANGAGAAGAAAGAGAAGGAAPFYAGWDKPEQADVAGWAKNKNFADTFTLAKTARELEGQNTTLRQGKGYPVPGQDGKVDQTSLAAWRTLTGVPETADKYEIPVPENNPYPQFAKYMGEELHAAHVPAAMAPALAKGYERAVQRMETELRAQEEAASTQGLETLKASWGAHYQERMGVANAAKAWIAKEAGGLNEIQLRTLESVLGTPQWLTMLYKLGAGNREAVFAGDGGSPPSFKGGATEGQAKIDEMTAKRAAGQISQREWDDFAKKGGEMEQLIDQITKGFATQ